MLVNRLDEFLNNVDKKVEDQQETSKFRYSIELALETLKEIKNDWDFNKKYDRKMQIKINKAINKLNDILTSYI